MHIENEHPGGQVPGKRTQEMHRGIGCIFPDRSSGERPISQAWVCVGSEKFSHIVTN